MQNGRGSGIEGNWQLHNFISLLAHSLFIRWLCACIRKALLSANLSTKPARYFPFTGRKSPCAFLDAVEKHGEHTIIHYFASTTCCLGSRDSQAAPLLSMAQLTAKYCGQRLIPMLGDAWTDPSANFFFTF